jgi:GntR family histidine utilization transcriptional repressor
MLDRPPPLYERVKEHILQRMRSGEWPEGARLPSEFDFMEAFGASRMTVHRALREMSAAGFLRRVQGVGTFVRRDKPSSELLEITDIAQDILARGHAHRARLLTLEARRADAALAQIFAIRRGAKLFHSEVVHFEDDVPVQLEQRCVLPRFAPDYLRQDFGQLTTARYLQSMAPASEVEHSLEACAPDERACLLLEIGPHEPCLVLERRTWTPAGPATRSVLTHPGQRYSLRSRYTLPAGRG